MSTFHRQRNLNNIRQENKKKRKIVVLYYEIIHFHMSLIPSKQHTKKAVRCFNTSKIFARYQCFFSHLFCSLHNFLVEKSFADEDMLLKLQ